MMTNEPGKPGRKRGRLRVWHLAVGLVVLTIAGVLVMRWHWRHEFHRRIEAIRAAGLPVTPQELDASYTWPQSGDNAASWVLGAAAVHWRLSQEDLRRLERLVSYGSERPDPTQSIPGDLKDLLERHVESNSEALESLHQAGSIAECRYPVDLSKGPGTLMQYLSDVRDGCQLLCFEAVRCAEQADPIGAAEAITTTLRVARSLDREPILVSHSIRMWLAVWAASTLERALNQVEFTDRQLGMLQKAFADIRRDDGLLRAIAGTRCIQLVLFEKPQAMDRKYFDHLPPVALLEVYDALGLSAREGIAFLDYMEECMRIAQLPAFQRRAAAKMGEAHLLSRKGIVLGEVRYMSGLISRDVQALARIEVAATALAVQRYRLGHGGPPETLEQLVPDYVKAVPQDPFDGAPLRYGRLDRGFVVYSVGEDGKDDGGKEQSPQGTSEQGETYDFVFRIER